MQGEDRKPLQELVKAEPADPSKEEADRWLDVYRRLIDMHQRQLDEHRRFVDSVPAPVRRYLDEANEQLLRQEIDVFKQRAEHWERVRAT